MGGIFHEINFIALTAILMGGVMGCLLLMIPFYALWTVHKRKIEEMRLQQGLRVGDITQQALDQVRAELKQLRDTTTNYDMSFDSALQRIESRVQRLELNSKRAESTEEVYQRLS